MYHHRLIQIHIDRAIESGATVLGKREPPKSKAWRLEVAALLKGMDNSLESQTTLLELFLMRCAQCAAPRTAPIIAHDAPHAARFRRTVPPFPDPSPVPYAPRSAPRLAPPAYPLAHDVQCAARFCRTAPPFPALSPVHFALRATLA